MLNLVLYPQLKKIIQLENTEKKKLRTDFIFLFSLSLFLNHVASLNVQHDVIFNITNNNVEDTYKDLVKEVGEVLSNISDTGRLSYAFPPFIYSGVIRCIVNMCLSFFVF